jgi:hypothetical protein
MPDIMSEQTSKKHVDVEKKRMQHLIDEVGRLRAKLKNKDIEYTPFGFVDYSSNKMQCYFDFVKETVESCKSSKK